MMQVYFCVYLLLHGLTLRLLIIAGMVLCQCSFQMQYPKLLWDAINSCTDLLSPILTLLEGGGGSVGDRDEAGTQFTGFPGTKIGSLLALLVQKVQILKLRTHI